MSAIPAQTLLDESKCYLCYGVSQADALKLALLNRIAAGGSGGAAFLPSGTKVYQALLSQTGNPGDAPTAVVLTNTLGTVTYTYGGAGGYEIHCTGAFDLNKLGVLVEQTNWQNLTGWQVTFQDANTLALTSYDISPFPAIVPQDGVLNNSFIQILVFP